MVELVVRIPLFTRTSGLALTWCLLLLFLQCRPHLTPGGSRVLADPARIDEGLASLFLPLWAKGRQP